MLFQVISLFSFLGIIIQVFAFRLLLYHTHCLQKPVSYYLDPPNLPPEELEPPPEKVVSSYCVLFLILGYFLVLSITFSIYIITLGRQTILYIHTKLHISVRERPFMLILQS